MQQAARIADATAFFSLAPIKTGSRAGVLETALAWATPQCVRRPRPEATVLPLVTSRLVVLNAKPEMSIAKLSLTNNLWRTANFVTDVLGPRAIADTGEWGTYAWSQLLLGVPGLKVAGGTDEVMKNIVGERVLGLPKDTGIDSTTAFKDLMVNENN